jgi:large subunit ribosomal protein L21
MYAVIRSGGKQYKVQEGDVLQVEISDAKVGDKASFAEVLLVSDGKKVQIGAPLLSGIKIPMEILEEKKGVKTVSFKFRRRKGYHKTIGHRQRYHSVKVGKITA